MNILTERCAIREFESGDGSGFMEYRNDMGWMRYQGFKGMSRNEYEKILLKHSPLAKGRQFAMIDTRAEQIIGNICL